jgi:hypothetical protein
MYQVQVSSQKVSNHSKKFENIAEKQKNITPSALFEHTAEKQKMITPSELFQNIAEKQKIAHRRHCSKIQQKNWTNTNNVKKKAELRS